LDGSVFDSDTKGKGGWAQRREVQLLAEELHFLLMIQQEQHHEAGSDFSLYRITWVTCY